MEIQVTELLKEEAKKNEAFNAIAFKWATRERARNQVTVHSLKASMDQEGFQFKKEDYEAALVFLSKLGFGEIKKTKAGKICALENIKVKLQDIGKVAVAGAKEIKPFRQKNKYRGLEMVETTAKQPMRRSTDKVDSSGPIQLPKKEDVRYEISLQVIVHGAKITFAGPVSVSPQQLGAILIRFNEMTAERK